MRKLQATRKLHTNLQPCSKIYLTISAHTKTTKQIKATNYKEMKLNSLKMTIEYAIVPGNGAKNWSVV